MIVYVYNNTVTLDMNFGKKAIRKNDEIQNTTGTQKFWVELAKFSFAKLNKNPNSVFPRTSSSVSTWIKK